MFIILFQLWICMCYKLEKVQYPLGENSKASKIIKSLLLLPLQSYKLDVLFNVGRTLSLCIGIFAKNCCMF